MKNNLKLCGTLGHLWILLVSFGSPLGEKPRYIALMYSLRLASTAKPSMDDTAFTITSIKPKPHMYYLQILILATFTYVCCRKLTTIYDIYLWSVLTAIDNICCSRSPVNLEESLRVDLFPVIDVRRW